MTIDLDELERLDRIGDKPDWTQMEICWLRREFEPYKPTSDEERLACAARNALPALIRIARAAKAYWQVQDSFSKVTDEEHQRNYDELDEALREVKP